MADVKNNDRKDRLSAALRENLKRRKQQLRGRAGRPSAEPEPARGEPAPDTEGSAGGNDREQRG